MSPTEPWTTERLLTTAARLAENAWNDRLLAIGITHAGLVTLRTVEAYGPLLQIELAEQLHVTAQTVGRTLARLEQQGLIIRSIPDGDRRAFLVDLTARGRIRLAEAEKGERSLMAELEQASPQLRNLLMKLVERLLPVKTATDS
ncbi:MarR family transcriptional regulator [Arthrobacter sp. JZ12]|uniref:MarR family winged helix-turn-helix transcriptional regulator n=1 Tax=Arthrobacter sp. JZ12 TaxID=2654190 RepID=UPI002B48FDDC|nr:MarR family transcriptional regulator [Arthrobacter sp. JZ12]WRH26083.1 MarR family transcriptional regulator [Arthrobacter sp. JZ12]